MTLPIGSEYGDVADLKVICVQDEDIKHLFAVYKSSAFALVNQKDNESKYHLIKLIGDFKAIE